MKNKLSFRIINHLLEIEIFSKKIPYPKNILVTLVLLHIQTCFNSWHPPSNKQSQQSNPYKNPVCLKSLMKNWPARSSSQTSKSNFKVSSISTVWTIAKAGQQNLFLEISEQISQTKTNLLLGHSLTNKTNEW